MDLTLGTQLSLAQDKDKLAHVIKDGLQSAFKPHVSQVSAEKVL